MYYRSYYGIEYLDYNPPIAHHGILGQKWGKKNGPPYPLDPSDHSAREKKAGWRKSLNKSSGDNQTSKKKFQLSDKQKTALKVAGALAIAGAVAYGGYKLKNSGLNREELLSRINGKCSTDVLGQKVEIPKFKVTEENVQSCAANVNPTRSGTNCGSCATATVFNMMTGEHRQALSEVPEHMRGIKSNGEKTLGYDPDKLIDCFEGGSWTNISPALQNRKAISDELEKTILSYGEGSKGIFYSERIRKTFSGHYFSWTVLNGKVNVVESQPSREGIVWNKNFYSDVGQMFDPMYDVKVARLDNKKIKPGRQKDLFK